MSPLVKATVVFAIAGAIGGCVMHGPEGVAYSTPSGGVGVTGVGASGGAAGGSLSGSGDSNGEKDKRGNTPIGMDRDGHGPAAGAIIDPTGAATRGRPY